MHVRLQPLPGAENPRFDGADGNAKGLGDLLVVQPFEVSQDHGFAQFDGERRQGAIDLIKQQLAAFDKFIARVKI